MTSNYRHTQHASTTFAGEPYLLQPMDHARVDTALAIPGRTALSAAHMMAVVRSSASQQPCGPGPACHGSADCPDHYCTGHPVNTGARDSQSTEPTDFAGLERPADDPSPLERVGYDLTKGPGRWVFWLGLATNVITVIALFLLAKQG